MYEQRSLLQFASILFLSCCFTRLSGTGKGYSSPQACSTIASGSGVTLSVPQREVKGTVGQPVNLSVSYVTLTPYSTLKIQWCLFSENTPFVTLSRSNCSPGPVTPRYNCSDHRVTRPSYQHRVHLDPDTGSLWLRDFQSDDSGVYVISVYRDGVNTTTEGNVTLTVYNETGSCLQHDSVAMETHDQPIEGMRQDFAEGQDSVLNGDLTYSLLQWSEHRIPAASGGDPQDSGLETIYAFPQKVNRR
ncbi:uncharacterized protein LOC122541371 isoform X4 [Chiloscyllium plagiosum]|uniref:uncharacterized protein LOC122541371 isoform X4 n=1 Tax=Chiloscyllium plagiosum TaxID=36176 RepID=UPI001CB84C03|nr:uncharacterized protein LOC122541371 isoform X4 [Chiloscyllium plagiosum]